MYPLRFLMKNLYVEFRNPHFQYKTVRWRTNLKKRFWLPVAKSKEFRPPKVREPEPDQPEYNRLRILYDIHAHSLRTFIYNDESVQLTKDAFQYVEPKENIEASYLRNENWNKKCAELREGRLEKLKQEEEEAAMRLIEKKENAIKAKKEKVMKIARLELEKSKSYIKQENLDEALEQCLASTVNHYYAIDLKGNVYKNNEVVKNLSKEKEVQEVSQ